MGTCGGGSQIVAADPGADFPPTPRINTHLDAEARGTQARELRAPLEGVKWEGTGPARVTGMSP